MCGIAATCFRVAVAAGTGAPAPEIALASVGLLALTLALRLRTTQACQLAPLPSGQGPRTTEHASKAEE
jgi:hypothetical protein